MSINNNNTNKYQLEVKDYNLNYNLLESLIIGQYVQEEDILRWFSQEFIFSKPNFTLKQGHGGPCGILAVVQAEIIRYLFFDSLESVNNNNNSQQQQQQQQILNDELLNISEEKQILSFSKALWKILWRCKSQNCVYLVYSIEVISNLADCLNLPVLEFYSEDMFLESFPQVYLPYFTSGSGCFLFLLSLILTRGYSVIKRDMDDSTSLLLGQYGHCTQELMNLLLIGEAVSNVFDGNLKMDESSTDSSPSSSSLMLKGVSHQSDIGYLTQLEALRYCQVGSYLKFPLYPIWVIGSSSHFTVLFSLNREINRQSDDEQLFSRVQREFKAIDTHECGFITEDKLSLLLSRLSVSFTSNIYDVNRFSNHISLDGGIILWSTFWQNISKILTGTTLDSLLNSNQNSTNNNNTNQSDNNNNNNSHNNNSNHNNNNLQVTQRLRSDSEIARELQASFDDNYDSNIRQQIGLTRTDSEIARQLQDEWNNEDSVTVSTPTRGVGNNSNNNNNNNNSSTYLSPSRPTNEISSPSNSLKRHRSDSIATKDDENFICFHYNGFDSLSTNETNSSKSTSTLSSTLEVNSKTLHKKLTKFKLYRRSSDSSIGQSMAFTSESIIFADSGISKLEEVLRTRWIGCRIDFLGNPVPIID